MKRILASVVLALAAVALFTQTSALAATVTTPTPIMGWSGYNEWGPNVSQDEVGNNAWRLVHSGLAADGYKYVDLDAGWAAPSRDAAGELVPSPTRFSRSIASMASYVHSLGLKFGIYEPAGTSNCVNTMPGGYSGGVSHYQQDAEQFAYWGVDFIKFDYCGMTGVDSLPQFAGRSPEYVAQQLAQQMSNAITVSGRPMILDVNDANGLTNHADDWVWGSSVGADMWRTACDVRADYSTIVRQIFGDETDCGHSGTVYLGSYAGPGKGWNDPDMLEIGNGTVTGSVAKVQLSLWAEEAAPLILVLQL